MRHNFDRHFLKHCLSELTASQLRSNFNEKLSLRAHCVTTPTKTLRRVTTPTYIFGNWSIGATTSTEISSKTVSQTALRHNSDRSLLKNCLSEPTASQLRLTFLETLGLKSHCVTTPTETWRNTASHNALRHSSCRNLLKNCFSPPSLVVRWWFGGVRHDFQIPRSARE